MYVCIKKKDSNYLALVYIPYDYQEWVLQFCVMYYCS